MNYLFIVLIAIHGNTNSCPGMVQLAKELNMDKIHPNRFSIISQPACCQFGSGLTCTGSNFVTGINWSNLNLNGTISTIPWTIVTLKLNDNKITGNVPMAPFLDASYQFLQVLDVSNNRFSGSLPQLLPTLKEIRVQGNYLTGAVPSIPDSVEQLFLGRQKETSNKLTGTVRVAKPVYLYTNGNYISRVIIQSATAIARCDLSDNPLLELRDDANLAKCVKNGFHVYP